MSVPRFAFFQDHVVPYDEARLPLLTHAFNYGTAVVGGVRGYWNNEEGQLFLFRPVEHLQGLRVSAKLLGMEVSPSEAELVHSATELLRAEQCYEDCYLRAVAYYSDESLGVRVHDLTTHISMIVVPYGHYGKADTGIHVTVSSWRSVDGSMIPTAGRSSAAFVNVAVARTAAQRAGFDETILLDHTGRIAENPLGSVFIARGGEFITPVGDDLLMGGVTKRSVMELIRGEMSMEVVQRPIDRNEIYLADEVFLCGTGVQVTPVTWVDHVPIAGGRPGKCTARLRELYFSAVRRSLERYTGWCVPVHESRRYLDRSEIDERRGARTRGADF